MNHTKPQLDYIVVRCADIERSREFYNALGLALVREQHGNGTVHYASDLGGAVLELYPSIGQPTAGLRI